jgi:plasmid stability protein
MHNASMPSITIRDVPADVRDKLAARAAAEGRSMQQYLVKELTRLVERPTNREIFERAQRRARRAGLNVTTEDILDALDADRR